MSFFLRTLFLLSFLLFAACDGGEQPATGTVSEETGGLFTTLPAAETGVDFINKVTSDFTHNYISNAYLYNGAGIGVIDYDRDGLQDLFFVSNQGQNRLYRNLGDWEFADVTELARLGGPGNGFSTGVSIADVNADGYPDIYICRFGIDNSVAGVATRKNLLYINSADGIFTERAAEFGLDSDHPSTHAVFFDYDGDGDLDLYQVNTPTEFATANNIRAQKTARGLERVVGPKYPYESDQLFRNDGGRFTDATESAGLVNRAYGLSVSVGDFNDDGRPDLYVANDYIEDDHVYINQGNGTFRDYGKRYLRHTSLNSMGSDIGDLNNDGIEDLVSLDMMPEGLTRQRLLQNGMRPDRYDVLVRAGYGHQLMRNQMQLGTGQGFSEVGASAGITNTDWSWAPLLVDFDQDGNQDLFISNGYRYDLTDMDFVSFTTDSILALGGLTEELFGEFGDFLQLVPSFKQPNYLYRNIGQLQFENVAASWNVGEPAYSGSAVTADLDNDGDLDLVVGNHEQPPFLHRNEANQARTGNYLLVSAEGPRLNRAGIGARIMATVGDQKMVRTLQPVRGFLGSNEPVVHFGLGAVNSIDQLEVGWPDGKRQILRNVGANQELIVRYDEADGVPRQREAADPFFTFPADQLGVRHQHVEDAFNDFDRQILQARSLSREGPAIAAADLDGDGLDELFVGAAAGSGPALYRQNAQGKFSRDGDFPKDQEMYEDVVAHFFDADGDGDQDLYVGSGGNAAPVGDRRYADRLFLNSGGQLTLSEGRLPETILTNTGAICAFDYDSDGDFDLMIGGRSEPGAYPSAPASYLLRNDKGRFTDVTERVFPELSRIGMVTAIAAGDLSGDATPEVVIAGEWMALSIFSFADGRFTRMDNSPTQSVGLYHSLLLTDTDGDGQLDIVVGNEGTNSRFHPEAGRPVSMVAADFDGNGAIDPILAMADERGRLAPISTRDQLIKQLPKLKKQYVRYRDYSTSTVAEAVGEAALSDAMRFDLDRVESGVYSLRDGSWSFTALPAQAQIAPVRSMVAQDVNGDGQLDLLLVGNDYGLHVETGRIDAGNGTLLLAEGGGAYRFVPNRSHGFWASLDARGLVNFRTAKGKSGLAIANNNGPLGIYLLR